MSTLSESLRNALTEIFLPVVLATRSDAARRALFRSIGHTDSVAGDAGLRGAIADLTALIDSVSNVDPAAMQSWSGITQALHAGSRASAAVRSLPAAAQDPAVGRRLVNLGEELLEQLLARYLYDRHPVLYRLAAVLTLAVPADFAAAEPLVVEGSEMKRIPWRRGRLRFARVVPLLQDPWLTLGEAYLPNSLAAFADAHAAAAILFPSLGAAANALGLSWRIDTASLQPVPVIDPNTDDESGDDPGDTEEEVDSGTEPAIMPAADLNTYYERFLPRFLVALPPVSPGHASTAISVIVSSGQHPGGAGITVTPMGDLNVSRDRGSWRVTVAAQGQVPAFVGRPSGLALAPSSDPIIAGSARLSIDRISQSAEPTFVFGSATGTRLEIGAFRIGAEFAYAEQRSVLSITLDATSCTFVIEPADGDGFLQEVLPSEGVRTSFDFGLMLTSDGGLSLKGRPGLEADIPLGASAGNLVRIDSIHLGVAGAGGAVRGEVSAAGAVRIGPVTAVIDRVGIETGLSVPEIGGNLGPAELAVAFKPPNGIGLVIETAAVTGGGYLYFDPDKEEYAGVLQMELAETIAVTAIGLLTTRLPDGSKGFSLVISITARDFPPIQLGLGFRLSGVGGLIGVNRTVAVDVLRAGLKKGSLDAVLFPDDPLRNPAQIVSNIRKIFPPAEGRFVFGPMVVIDWGTPAVVTMELAVILELPSPVRLIVLGQIRAFLPREQRALVRLKMDVLGVLELDKGELAIDAVLYDSRMLTFAVSGDMALRVRWLTNPTFVMSIGGLNPNFKPPAAFPTLKRLTISLTDGDNPRLRLEAYLALTSNSLQIGARLDLRVAVSKFSIEGYLYFDALFEFSPFRFVAEIGAGVTLKWGGHTLLGVQLQLTLSGPSPWHASGKATFKIWIFSKSVSFDHTFGKDERPPVLPPADPLPELLAALRDPRSWSGGAPAGGRALVSVRATTSDDLLVHPLGRVAVRQRVVPLDITIARFGNTIPAGDRRFRITSVQFGDVLVTNPPLVTDLFAPGQFLDMTDVERLSRPSFEQLPSGVELATDAVRFGGQDDAGLMTVADAMYETVVVAPGGAVERSTATWTMPDDTLLAAAELGAAARAWTRRPGATRYAGTPRDLTPDDPAYVVVRTDDLRPATEIRDVDAQGTSYTAAEQALARHVEANPNERGRLTVVPRDELAGVA